MSELLVAIPVLIMLWISVLAVVILCTKLLVGGIRGWVEGVRVSRAVRKRWSEERANRVKGESDV